MINLATVSLLGLYVYALLTVKILVRHYGLTKLFFKRMNIAYEPFLSL